MGLGLIGLAVLLGRGGTAWAQDPTLAELKARLDKLEKENKEFRDKLKEVSPYVAPYGNEPPKQDSEKVKKIVNDVLKERDDKKKKDDDKKKKDDDKKKKQKDREGFVTGSDLGLTARWRSDQGLWFETKNKDVQSHIGFFFQWDTSYFTQSANLRPVSQLGDFQDGTFFRRMRPLWDGQAYDTIEWNVILALEQLNSSPANGVGLINLDEVWVGVFNIPYLGRVRVGHMKVPQGLEGNQMSSSRAMTFNENAAYTDAFYRIFATGVEIANTAFDQRMTWQLMGYRDDFGRANVGADFGDGTYDVTGRITGLLIDECEDRHLLHLGLSGTWRKGQKADNLLGLGQSGPDLVRLRARPELRDAIGGFGDGATLAGDSARLVDTGNIMALSTGVVGTELLYILGPFSVEAEWAMCYINGATTGTGRNLVEKTRSFNGGYITLSYFLTGEARNYDKSFGILARNYVTPFTNFWWHDGTVGLGAWEVAFRYSYLNLNDGPIQGGVMNGITVGLNWYLNSNLKVQIEYLHNNRYDKNTPQNGTVPGTVDGIGTRVQIQF
jgi:phosphate-selective porin OprO/OprP